MRAGTNVTGSDDEFRCDEHFEVQRLDGDQGAPLKATAEPADATEIARQVCDILKPILLRLLKAAQIATLGTVHTVDLSQTCAIIKVSASLLRRGGYLNDLGEHGFDSKKLNGVHQGSMWRIQVSEAHRFATCYWSRRHTRRIDGQEIEIRGRDV